MLDAHIRPNALGQVPRFGKHVKPNHPTHPFPVITSEHLTVSRNRK